MSMPYMIVPPQGADPADEWVKLGVAAHSAGDLPKAQQNYGQALRLDPRHALATQNLAIVYACSNLLNEALLTIERASMLDGVHGVIQMNWSLMALAADQIDVALATARKGVELSPNVNTKMALAMTLATAGLPSEAIPIYQDILKEVPNHPSAGPNICFVQTLTTATPKDLAEQRKLWHDANRFHGKRDPHPNTKDPNKVIRIGYVSGDYKTHSASMIFKSGVLLKSEAVQVYLYCSLPVSDDDVVTKEFKTYVGDRWRDISTLDDEKVDALVRQDQIDILVDLAGHTNGGRLPLFTRKPAPIQVTAWGFAHGTGCPEIDYFFADPVAIPEVEREFYVEKIVDLPCIVSYAKPPYDIKGKSSLPFFKNDYITFGSYARYEKMNDDCLKVFAQILRKVPESRLEFKDHGCRRPYSIRRIQSLMPDIGKERLLFSLATAHHEHMQSYQQADLILDPFPHSGGVVCLEQLYMGVPMVTMYGTQAAGRTSSSVLTSMGRTDWIAYSEEEYVAKAVAMVEDKQKLNGYRKILQAEFLASPVVAGYAEKVLEAYRTIWVKWCAQ